MEQTIPELQYPTMTAAKEFYKQGLDHAISMVRIEKIFATKEVKKVLDEIISSIEKLKP